MALVLNQQVETSLPIEIGGITPDQLVGKTIEAIEKLTVWHGRQALELAQLFKVSGAMDDSMTVVFQGNLQSVESIGTGMKSGTIRIESDAGSRVGSQMSGGKIQTLANVSDYLGAEMTGGVIEVGGNSGDFCGGHLPGSKIGMNRGSILIRGDVGDGLGRRMRRGTIAVGGSTGRLAGWEMLAGTIVMFGNCGAHVGAEMKRGTIVIAGGYAGPLLPTFRRGGRFPVSVLSMLSQWLNDRDFPFCGDVLQTPFNMFHGDCLHGGRGELFILDESTA